MITIEFSYDGTNVTKTDSLNKKIEFVKPRIIEFVDKINKTTLAHFEGTFTIEYTDNNFFFIYVGHETASDKIKNVKFLLEQKLTCILKDFKI